MAPALPTLSPVTASAGPALVGLPSNANLLQCDNLNDLRVGILGLGG
jgi:hypothetical protein